MELSCPAAQVKTSRDGAVSEEEMTDASENSSSSSMCGADGHPLAQRGYEGLGHQNDIQRGSEQEATLEHEVGAAALSCMLGQGHWKWRQMEEEEPSSCPTETR